MNFVVLTEVVIGNFERVRQAQVML